MTAALAIAALLAGLLLRRPPAGPARFREAEAALGLRRVERRAVGTWRGHALELGLEGDLGTRPDDRLPLALHLPSRALSRALRTPWGWVMLLATPCALFAPKDAPPWLFYAVAIPLAMYVLELAWPVTVDAFRSPTLRAALGPRCLGRDVELVAGRTAADVRDPAVRHLGTTLPSRIPRAGTGDPAVDRFHVYGRPASVLTLLDPETRALLAAHLSAGGTLGWSYAAAEVARPLRRGEAPSDVADQLAALAARLVEAAERAPVPALVERATLDPHPDVRAHALVALCAAHAVAGRELVDRLLGGRRPVDALGGTPEIRAAAALRLADEATPADLVALRAARRGADALLAPWIDRAIATAQARAPAGGEGRLALTDPGAAWGLSPAAPLDGAVALPCSLDGAPPPVAALALEEPPT